MAMATENETYSSKMSIGEEPDFAAMRDAVELRHGNYFMFASILFFQIVNWRLQSQGPPKGLAVDEWKWRNLYVSWIHAIIAAIWVVFCFLLYPELVANLMQHISYFTYFCVCFSTGYFIYDMLDVLVNHKLLGNWEIALHHVVVIGMFYYNILIKAHIAFNIIALTVELNSVFLHWRKLLQMVKKPYDSREYLIIKYLNLITFFVFRGFAHVLVSICCYYWRHKVSLSYFIGIVTTIIFLDILNVVLFWRLVKSDLLRGIKAGKHNSVCQTVKNDCAAMNGDHSNGYKLAGNNNVPSDTKPRRKDE